MKDFALLTAASNLLLDDSLVWSEDFEQIRSELGKWLLFEAGRAYALQEEPISQAKTLAELLTKDEYELT